MQVLGVERCRLRIVRSAPGNARGSGTVGVVHPSLRLPLSAIGLIAGFVAAACTSVPPEELSVPLPTTTVESESAPVAEMESESTAGLCHIAELFEGRQHLFASRLKRVELLLHSRTVFV